MQLDSDVLRADVSNARCVHPGQLLVLLTDGVTRSMSPNGKEWGSTGALNYLVTHRDRPAQQLVDGLYHEALRFTCNEPQKDDITSVILKVDFQTTSRRPCNDGRPSVPFLEWKLGKAI